MKTKSSVLCIFFFISYSNLRYWMGTSSETEIKQGKVSHSFDSSLKRVFNHLQTHLKSNSMILTVCKLYPP